MSSKHLVKRDAKKMSLVRRHDVRHLAKNTERIPVVWHNDLRDEVALQRNMDRMLDEISEDFGLRPMWLWEEPIARFIPQMEIQETPNDIRVTVELPGVEKDDVEVTVEGNDTLRLRGEKNRKREDKSKQTFRFERSYGSFERVIPLSIPVEARKAEAHMKKGVLSITLPKIASERVHEHKIEIKAA